VLTTVFADQSGCKVLKKAQKEESRPAGAAAAKCQPPGIEVGKGLFLGYILVSYSKK
jgi:hypothetical protein